MVPIASGDAPPSSPGVDGPPGGGPRADDDDDDVNPFDGSAADQLMWQPDAAEGGNMVPPSRDTNAMLAGVGTQVGVPEFTSPGVDGDGGPEAFSPVVLDGDGAQAQTGPADNTLIDRPVTCPKIDINYEVRKRKPVEKELEKM